MRCQLGRVLGLGVKREREAPGLDGRNWFLSIPEEETGSLIGGCRFCSL